MLLKATFNYSKKDRVNNVSSSTHSMVSIETFRKIALSFPGTEEKPHFDRMAFKVIGKRIFATIKEGNNTANIKLPLHDQTVYCALEAIAVYPIPNKFGLQGWTSFELNKLPAELVSDALLTAYQEVMKTQKQ